MFANERFGRCFWDADDYLPADNVAKMSAGEPLTDTGRTARLNILRDVVHATLESGESIVLACSALKADFRLRLLAGNDGLLVYLKGDRDLIERRMRTRRGHFMGPSMIDSQFAALEEPGTAFTVDVAQDVDANVDAIVDKVRSGS